MSLIGWKFFVRIFIPPYTVLLFTVDLYRYQNVRIKISTVNIKSRPKKNLTA